jgi:hypothetical protein
MSSLALLAIGLVTTIVVVPTIWFFAPRILRLGRSGGGNSEELRLQRETDEKDRASILPLLTAVTRAKMGASIHNLRRCITSTVGPVFYGA